MSWQEWEIFLGKFHKEDAKVIPAVVVFRVTIAGGNENDSFEFTFNPKDPNDNETRFTQILPITRRLLAKTRGLGP